MLLGQVIQELRYLGHEDARLYTGAIIGRLAGSRLVRGSYRLVVDEHLSVFEHECAVLQACVLGVLLKTLHEQRDTPVTFGDVVGMDRQNCTSMLLCQADDRPGQKLFTRISQGLRRSNTVSWVNVARIRE